MQINNTTSNFININQSKTGAEKALEKIAALRESAADNPANMLIADALGSQLSGYTQGLENVNSALAMAQIAQGVTSQLGQDSADLAAMSVRYNSAALGSSEKAMLTQEFSARVDAMAQSVQSASFNGKPLFGGTLEFSTGRGTTSMTLNAPSMSGLDIASSESIERFTTQLGELNSSVGSADNALQSESRSLMESIIQTAAAKSRLNDTDIAKSVEQYQSNSIKLDASLIAQAHQTDLLKQRMGTLLG